jgi:hypothetical protein
MSTVSKDGIHRTQLAVRIPEDLLKQVRIHCVETEKSIQDFVAHALANQLGMDRQQPEA